MLFVCTGCGDSHESLSGEMVDTMNQMTKVLAEVKDKDSAKSAGPKLEALGKEMKDIQKRSEALGKPDEAAQKSLKESFEKPMSEAMDKFMKEMMRIAMNPELADALPKDMGVGGMGQ